MNATKTARHPEKRFGPVMTTTIRPLQRTDRGQWDALWQSYLAFYKQTLAPSVTNATWERLTCDSGPVFGFAAVNKDGRLVGFVHYLFHPVTWSETPRCYLEDLFVSDAARGQGVGRALIEAVYAAADDMECEQVYWETAEDNATARRLYDLVATKTEMVKYKNVRPPKRSS